MVWFKCIFNQVYYGELFIDIISFNFNSNTVNCFHLVTSRWRNWTERIDQFLRVIRWEVLEFIFKSRSVTFEPWLNNFDIISLSNWTNIFISGCASYILNELALEITSTSSAKCPCCLVCSPSMTLSSSNKLRDSPSSFCPSHQDTHPLAPLT